MFVHAYTLDTKIVSEYDQEIPQSQTADNPVAHIIHLHISYSFIHIRYMYNSA